MKLEHSGSGSTRIVRCSIVFLVAFLFLIFFYQSPILETISNVFNRYGFGSQNLTLYSFSSIND
jgi:hypothetical protein